MHDVTHPASPPRRNKLSRREALIGGSLLATALISYLLTPSRKLDLLGGKKLENLIPPTVGPWKFVTKSGLVVPPADAMVDQLYAQVLTRVYAAESRPDIMLLIAQSPVQTGVLQVHRPEICYPVGGFKLSGGDLHFIHLNRGSVRGRFFTAEGESRTEQLVYWTRVGTSLPANWAEQRLAVAAANLRGEIPDGVLVRISTISPDREASLAALDEFATKLIYSVGPQAQAALVGPQVA